MSRWVEGSGQIDGQAMSAVEGNGDKEAAVSDTDGDGLHGDSTNPVRIMPPANCVVAAVLIEFRFAVACRSCSDRPSYFTRVFVIRSHRMRSIT